MFPFTLLPLGLVLNSLLGDFPAQVLLESVGRVVGAFAVLFLKLPLALANAFLTLSAIILNWVTSPGFISLSYTSTDANSNPIVWAGWSVTRDLANIGFVVALIIIGLGTALKINEYQYQKTLPRLIAMMILVNFTPIICGVIVDFSNILMSFFLSSGADVSVIINRFQENYSFVDELIRNTGTMSIEVFSMYLVMMFFCIITGFIFLVFSLVFILRYIAIWILVILSPLAFFSYLFPFTKGFWRRWWQQLLQWCFIGVTVGFIIYLNSHILSAVYERQIISYLPEREATGLPNVLNSIFPFVIPVFLLWYGFFTALSSSATGASFVINFAQNQASSWSRRGLSAARDKAGTLAREHKPAGVVKLGERMATFAPKTAPEKMIAPLAHRVGRALGPSSTEARKSSIEKGASQIKGIQDVNLATSRVLDMRGDEQIGGIDEMINKGGPYASAITDKLTDEQKERTIATANRIGAVPRAERLARAFFIDLAESQKIDLDHQGNEDKKKAIDSLTTRLGFKTYDQEIGKNKADWEAKGYQTFFDKLIGEAKGNEVKEFSKNFWTAERNSGAIMDAVQKFWGGPQLAKAAEEFGRRFTDSYMEEAEKENKGLDWFLQHNKRALTYLAGNAAQDFGFRSIQGLSQEKIREEANKWPKDKTPSQLSGEIGILKNNIRDNETRITGFTERAREVGSTSKEEQGEIERLKKDAEGYKEKLKMAEELLKRKKELLSREREMEATEQAVKETQAQPTTPGSTPTEGGPSKGGPRNVSDAESRRRGRTSADGRQRKQ